MADTLHDNVDVSLTHFFYFFIIFYQRFLLYIAVVVLPATVHLLS